MYMLREQEFDFGIFMKKRGWNSVISITILASLIIVIALKTPV